MLLVYTHKIPVPNATLAEEHLKLQPVLAEVIEKVMIVFVILDFIMMTHNLTVLVILIN